MSRDIQYSERRDLPRAKVLALYQANAWSSAGQPERLMAALRGSHSLVTAWAGEQLVGLGNAISDGHLVVYYPHLLVHPEFHGRGIGRALIERLRQGYEGFHQHVLLATPGAPEFYERCGFTRADTMTPMWIYTGDDH